MDTSLMCFASDLVDEGVDTVIANAVERAGVDGLSMAAAYHRTRDIFPHNPTRRVVLGSGGVGFAPEPRRYGALRPNTDVATRGRDVLGELCDAADSAGIRVDAWTVFLHHDSRADSDATGAVRNAYGDVYPATLCATDPRVREYVLALTADITRYPVRSVLAEALHLMPFQHGYHHERSFLPLGGSARLLLQLCFCDACMVAATDRGIDAGRLRAAVRTRLDDVLSGAPEDSASELPGCAAELDAYLVVRTDAVGSLVADVAAVAGRAAVDLWFIDPVGVTDASGPASEHVHRVFGVRYPTLSRAGSLLVPGYATRPGSIGTGLARCRQEIGREPDLGVILRPMWPDCTDRTNFADKVAAARAARVARLDVYHYGLMPLDRLKWVRDALDQ